MNAKCPHPLAGFSCLEEESGPGSCYPTEWFEALQVEVAEHEGDPRHALCLLWLHAVAARRLIMQLGTRWLYAACHGLLHMACHCWHMKAQVKRLSSHMDVMQLAYGSHTHIPCAVCACSCAGWEEEEPSAELLAALQAQLEREEAAGRGVRGETKRDQPSSQLREAAKQLELALEQQGE